MVLTHTDTVDSTRVLMAGRLCILEFGNLQFSACCCVKHNQLRGRRKIKDMSSILQILHFGESDSQGSAPILFQGTSTIWTHRLNF